MLPQNMKMYGPVSLITLITAILLASFSSSHASTVVWTNTAGGTWSAETNWSPNVIPSEGDDVQISASGTYDVSLDTDVTVNSLVIGGAPGMQTLHTGTSQVSPVSFCVIYGNGAIDIEGGALRGPGPLTVYGTVNWDGGSLGNGGSVTVEHGGAVVLVGGDDHLDGALTNAGAVVLYGGNLQMLGACFDTTGMLLNLTNGIVDFEGDVSIMALCGSESITNYGTVMKSGASGTSDITAPFYNLGKLDIESGTISLDSTYSLTNGNVNFGITDLYDYGTLAVYNGTGELGGSVSATLVGDYQPIATNEFPVVEYGLESGAFSSTNLPYIDAWTTNYTESSFNLVVLNARSFVAPIPDQTTAEFSTLTLNTSATDADIPPQTLIYSLSNAPAGMTINSNTGVLTWTPAQTQSPSTNIVTVLSTDNGTPSLTGSTNFTVLVYEVNVPPDWPVLGLQTVNDSSLLTVNDSAKETNIHASITGYALIKPPAGAKITSKGMVTWTPTPQQGPSTNLFVSVVTNSDPLALSNPIVLATNSFTVIVFAPSLVPIPNYSVSGGDTLTFTAGGADNDTTRTLSFSLVDGPPTATIDASTGVFSWQTTKADIGATNNVTIRVSDNNVPPITASQSFSIQVVAQPTSPTMDSVQISNGQILFEINGSVGFNYTIQSSAVLPAVQWTTVQTVTPTASPFTFTPTNSGAPVQFYRVLLSP